MIPELITLVNRDEYMINEIGKNYQCETCGLLKNEQCICPKCKTMLTKKDYYILERFCNKCNTILKSSARYFDDINEKCIFCGSNLFAIEIKNKANITSTLSKAYLDLRKNSEQKAEAYANKQNKLRKEKKVRDYEPGHAKANWGHRGDDK